VDLKV
jgi:hypothetical protein